MRYAIPANIAINGKLIRLAMFASSRNRKVLEQLADMPNVQELQKCLDMYHRDEIWIIKQKDFLNKSTI